MKVILKNTAILGLCLIGKACLVVVGLTVVGINALKGKPLAPKPQPQRGGARIYPDRPRQHDAPKPSDYGDFRDFIEGLKL